MKNINDTLLEKYHYNAGLDNLPDERWKETIGFEDDAVSDTIQVKIQEGHS